MEKLYQRGINPHAPHLTLTSSLDIFAGDNMKKLFLSLGLALSLTGFAQAKTPPEVLKSYKAYKTAIKEKNSKEASEQAYSAWQKAEELIGDSRVTGDLADNFARSVSVPIDGRFRVK
jgi:hypothetical protein